MKVNVTWDQEDAAILLARRPPHREIPAARRHRGEWLQAAEAGALRVACGFSLRTIAEACGVDKNTVWRWEKGSRVPKGAAGARYCRVIQGLARHMEIPEDE